MEQVSQPCSRNLIAVDIAHDGLEFSKSCKFGTEGMGEGDNPFIGRELLANFIGDQVNDKNPAARPVILGDQSYFRGEFTFSGIEVGVVISKSEICPCIQRDCWNQLRPVKLLIGPPAVQVGLLFTFFIRVVKEIFNSQGIVFEVSSENRS